MNEMNETVCPKCGKKFESTISPEEKPKCYDCILMDISNGCPEEGDMNTARILSGTLSPEEKNDLMESFAAVEEGRSGTSVWDEAYTEEDRCPGCGEYGGFCRCR